MTRRGTSPGSPTPPTAAPPAPSKKTRWIAEGEIACSGPGCSNPIPGGYYGKAKTVYLCSGRCASRRQIAMGPEVECDCGCGTRFKPTGHRPGSRRFVNSEHLYAWRRRELDETKVGRFAALLAEFMEDAAPKRYAEATLNCVRSNLGNFFFYLNQNRIRSLESVTPKTITGFLNHLMNTRRTSAGRVVTGNVRRLFDWLLLTGRRKASNPVIPSFHSQRKVKRLPRPYEARDLELIWKLLAESGDVQLQLAVALGQEAGLRIGEVSNLRLNDVDFPGQQLFVRLPTKTGVERVAPFHTLSKAMLEQWLAARGEQRHDHLLVAPSGGPLYKYNLRKRLIAVLCGPGKLERFSFHRLRARAATTVARGGADLGSVMTLFGWRNPAVAAGYVSYLPEDVRKEYDRAMSAKAAGAVPEPTTLSLDEFFANLDATTPLTPLDLDEAVKKPK
jgi:integrase/recombinase XerC